VNLLWGLTGPEPVRADPSAALTELVARLQTGTWSGLATVDGRPAANTELFVLDPRLRPVPAGVTGELFVGGAGMPDGYLGRPGLTAERFPPSPFGAGERMYRTGELARFRPDGRLRLVGPVELEVTVRGYRLHLGEIENRLATHPAVAQVAVAVHDDGLVAYLVTRAGVPAPTIAELREHLRDAAPGYLLGTIVTVGAVPRTRAGQVDRDALPAPDGGQRQARRVPPRDAVESLVLDCFRRVLDRPELGVTDDFFDHGGSSMAATKLLAELEQATGHRFVLRELFRETTPEAVATRLRSAAGEPDAHDAPATLQLPRDLSCAPLHPDAWSPGHVLLTGVGGLLGVALLERLLADEQVMVTCLLPVGDDEEARARLHRTTGEFGIDPRRFGGRLVPIAGDVSAERFGLPAGRYTALAGEVAVVYHAPGDPGGGVAPASAVVRGTHQVIRFAAVEGGKVVHLLQPLSGSDESQRLGEELAYQAACRDVPVTIIRSGSATAHRSTGASDPADPLTLCLTAALRFGLLPELPNLPLPVLPVDQVADAIVRVGRCPAADGQVIELVNARPVTVSHLAAVLAQLGRPVRLVPLDALSPEQSRLLAALSAGEPPAIRPAIDADRAAQVLGQPLHFADLTTQYVRRAIGYLTANRSDGEAR
jgi:myxalamid-type nonribosomal peptide synthetase MxaA